MNARYLIFGAILMAAAIFRPQGLWPRPADRAPRKTDMRLLSVRGLTKRFGSVTALENVDLAVDAGEIVSVIGPNGAGKTTF